jgi:hypothetical protein
MADTTISSGGATGFTPVSPSTTGDLTLPDRPPDAPTTAVPTPAALAEIRGRSTFESLADGGGTYVADAAIGVAKGTVNTFVNAPANLVNRVANAGLSLTPTAFRFRTDLEATPSNSTQEAWSQGVELASLAIGATAMLRGPALAAKADALGSGLTSAWQRFRGAISKESPPAIPRGPPQLGSLVGTTEPRALPARGTLPARGQFLGQGETAEVYESRDGTMVLKQMKPQIHGLDITESERAELARRTVEQHAALRDRGFPVPQSWVADGNRTVVVQAKAPGLRFEELPPEVRYQAASNKVDMVSIAKSDRRVAIDQGDPKDPYANFRFDAQGKIVAWFDPAIPYDTPQLARIGHHIYFRQSP